MSESPPSSADAARGDAPPRGAPRSAPIRSAPIRSAEVIAVGTELLLGEIVDTNSAWLARELAERSVDVYWSQRVGDNLERLRAAIDGALARSDLVLLTGGLGPTDDDLTREAIAAALGEEPAVDAGLERDLRERFASFGVRMPERNLKQAWLVPSAEALPNPRGTAPGWLVRTAREGAPRVLAALPGPPRELERMWRAELLPRLELPASSFYSLTLKSHGLGESTVAERLDGWTERGNPSVATYAKRDGVHVRVAAKADDAEAARALAEPAVAAVEAALGDHLWGRGDDELPALATARLAELGERLALVEGATGGLLLDLLSGAPGASTALRGGVVAWAPEAVAMLTSPSASASPGPASGPTSGPTSDSAALPGDPEALARLAARAAERFGATYLLLTGPVVSASLPAESSAENSAESGGDDGARVTLVVAGPPSPDGDDADGSGEALREIRTLRLPASGGRWLRERVAFAGLHLLLRALLRDRA